MSKRKIDDPNDEVDEGWLSEPELSIETTLEPDWNPEMFQPEADESAAFDEWELTLDEDLMTDESLQTNDDTAIALGDESAVDTEMLDIPSDWDADADADEAHSLDSLIVLPWETHGYFGGSEKRYVVRLDPTAKHSQWITDNVDNANCSTSILWVQGIRFEVSFEVVQGSSELLILGRAELEGRVLISVPKAH